MKLKPYKNVHLRSFSTLSHCHMHLPLPTVIVIHLNSAELKLTNIFTVTFASLITACTISSHLHVTPSPYQDCIMHIHIQHHSPEPIATVLSLITAYQTTRSDCDEIDFSSPLHLCIALCRFLIGSVHFIFPCRYLCLSIRVCVFVSSCFNLASVLQDFNKRYLMTNVAST